LEKFPITLDDGKFLVNVQAIQQHSNETSAMQPYLSHHAILTKEKENIFLTLMIQEQKVITGLQVIDENREAITSFERQVDEENGIRYEIFQLPQLFTLMSIQVQYEVEHKGDTFTGDEPLRLYFDPESVQNVEEIDL